MNALGVIVRRLRNHEGLLVLKALQAVVKIVKEEDSRFLFGRLRQRKNIVPVHRTRSSGGGEFPIG